MLLLNSLANWLLASTHAVRSFNPTHELGVRAPLGSKTVIVQMFEWTWDSVASECTHFVGPAGYGFVQGRFVISRSSEYQLNYCHSQPRSRTHTRISVVDRLSTCLIHHHFKTRRSLAIRKVGSQDCFQSRFGQIIQQHGIAMPRCGCRGYCGYVSNLL